MRFRDPRALDGSKRDEEKADRLKAFISDYVMSLAAPGVAAEAHRDVFLLSRTVDSPVLAAVLSLSNELAAVRAAVFAIIGTPGPDDEDLETLRAKAVAPFDLSIRIARNPRLVEAHEQLVLGGVSTWYGDCLRRDPLKRDAYESFAAGDLAKAGMARHAFQRLWQAAVPLRLGVAISSDAPVPRVGLHAPVSSRLERQ